MDANKDILKQRSTLEAEVIIVFAEASGMHAMIIMPRASWASERGFFLARQWRDDGDSGRSTVSALGHFCSGAVERPVTCRRVRGLSQGAHSLRA